SGVAPSEVAALAEREMNGASGRGPFPGFYRGSFPFSVMGPSDRSRLLAFTYGASGQSYLLLAQNDATGWRVLEPAIPVAADPADPPAGP
ncbi:MAG TPA: hypothetical protein VGS41_11760, partial [Chthonomonadales bacterium]|nr:hypothetical protein [Chthonomonadales bacterium]